MELEKQWQRPSPDDLLASTRTTTRGRLKIFFGACAGVGKTYAMLQEAQRLHQQGIDVLAGVVETHQRQETAALLHGLPLLPLQRIHHHGRKLVAFDLDAALARHPAVILMDELAFSNPHKCRHPKRWQDVEELLDAGIDVLATINVQHIESLNDIVGSITGIRVQETIPDYIFDSADEVVMVDLPPDDLQQRLHEGKVYLAGQAERAIEHFFRKGNLIALRELALRRMADRVDTQVKEFRDSQGASPVWHTTDSLMVCLGAHGGNDKLVRTAARYAAAFGCQWHAIYVETPKLHQIGEHKRRAILHSLKLAQHLGARTAILSDNQAEKAVIRYAREHNLGKVIIGQRAYQKWQWLKRWIRMRFAEKLARYAPDLHVISVALNDEDIRYKTKTAPLQNEKWRQEIKGYLTAIGICLAITLFSRTFLLALDKANLVTLYLLGVVLIALFFGRRPSIFAALINVISFDLFFVQPHFSLAVLDMQYLITFTVMLIVGLVVGNLTAGMRYQTRVARYREQRTRHLFEMTRELGRAVTLQDVVRTSYHFLSSAFDAKVCLLLPNKQGELMPFHAEGMGHLPIDNAIARWCCDKDQIAGAGTDTLPSVPYQLHPITASQQVLAILAIEPNNLRQLLIPEQQQLLQTFNGLIANALERLQQAEIAEQSRINIEREQLRNALLAALSHDLKTPLTVLFGQSEILLLDLSAEGSSHTEQVNQIRQQILTTSRLVNNLLDMARIQSGGIQVNLQWNSLQEITGSAIRSLSYLLDKHPLQIDIPADLLLYCDGNLIERVITNLLENAVKYTTSSTKLGIRAYIEAPKIHVEVWDEGHGIPTDQLQLIFNKFSRAVKESAIPGVGLGLAICSAIIRLHEGEIWAENHNFSENNKKGGASFHFVLPLKSLPDIDEIEIKQ